ncbi:hypothetical protein TNCV_3537031 [Trichonephila clavipes]|uniref:Tc1-like transposase DDE domain-containing protein n=1 Tax=Trichonephila clavipes TaxID=2585209 RepID=A0A8X6VWT6_TRICX|nr:hypothetical protein TNCV_3537031 [Trichonephila clavipes]
MYWSPWSPHTFSACPQPYSNRIMYDHKRHAVFKSSFLTHQIELLLWPTGSPDLSPIENVYRILTQRLARETPSSATPDQLWQYVEAT